MDRVPLSPGAPPVSPPAALGGATAAAPARWAGGGLVRSAPTGLAGAGPAVPFSDRPTAAGPVGAAGRSEAGTGEGREVGERG